MKSHAKLHWSRVLVAVVCLALLGLAQDKSGFVNAAAAQAEEAALRAVVERFFAAYGKKDLAGVMALWSEKSPDFASQKQALQQQFTTEDCGFGNPTISRVKIEAEKASLRVIVDSTAINMQGKQKREERLARNFGFVKESGEWKVWQYVSAESDLAEALVKAKVEAERSALLAEEKELITPELVQALFRQGNRFYYQREYPQAMAVYRQAHSIAEQIGYQNGVAIALSNVGLVHYSQGNYAQALEYYQKSVVINEALGDKAGVANTLLGIGLIHALQGNYAQALEHYQKNLALRETLGDKAGAARTLNNIGNVYKDQSRYAEAVEYFQKSLATLEELGDKAGVAYVLNGIGLVQLQQSNYVRALEYLQKSLEIKEALGDKAEVASTLNNIGDIHGSQGNYRQALEYFEKSLAISEALGNKAEAAVILGNIGDIHSFQGNYARALEYYQKSLGMKETLGDKAGIAYTLNGVGNIHYRQGNYVQALEYYQKSLALREALDDKARIADTLGNIGSVHGSQGNYARALEYYHKGLAISETLGDRAGIASKLAEIGSVHGLQGDHAQAMAYYQKSLAVQETVGNKDEMASTLRNIGDVHRGQGHYTQALDFAERAAAMARQIGSLDTLWQAYLTAGIAHRTLNQPAQARQAFADAINTIETMRTQVAGGEQEQQRFFEGKLSPYLAMADLLVAQNNAVEALTFAERAKARVLLDVLYSGRVNVSKALTSQEQEQERKLNNQLVSLNAQIYREKLRSQHDQARLTELDAQLQKARLDYEAFQTNLYAAHPELRTQRGEARALTLDQAGALLPDAKTALLEFVVTEDKTFLFVMTKNANPQTPVALRAFPIAVKQKELVKQTEQFRQQLAHPGNPVNKMAREFFDLLFKDAYSLIQGKNKLVIAPDGPLWEMPFQALLSPRNRYLIQDHAIATVPSLTVLREMIKLRQRKSSEDQTLLAVGNPALGAEVVERRKVLMDDPLDPLPDAEKQVQSLGKFYGPRRSRIYVGAAATEERVKAEASQHAILHLATHGILNDRSPMYSHLVLAQTDEKDKEDGLLEAWEILNLDLKADLAVLSACETARGRVGAGEGMIGLTWALFVAGVPTTVVSQWKVRSDSTAELMVEFHRLLQARDAKGAPRWSRAEALRQAALKLRKSNQYSHPFHWAGFVLVGDWR